MECATEVRCGSWNLSAMLVLQFDYCWSDTYAAITSRATFETFQSNESRVSSIFRNKIKQIECGWLYTKDMSTSRKLLSVCDFIFVILHIFHLLFYEYSWALSKKHREHGISHRKNELNFHARKINGRESLSINHSMLRHSLIYIYSLVVSTSTVCCCVAKRMHIFSIGNAVLLANDLTNINSASYLCVCR